MRGARTPAGCPAVLCQLPAAGAASLPATRRVSVIRAGPGATRAGPRCRRQGRERAARCWGVEAEEGLRAFLQLSERRVLVTLLSLFGCASAVRATARKL